jgi:hypothetical protein
VLGLVDELGAALLEDEAIVDVDEVDDGLDWGALVVSSSSQSSSSGSSSQGSSTGVLVEGFAFDVEVAGRYAEVGVTAGFA